MLEFLHSKVSEGEKQLFKNLHQYLFTTLFRSLIMLILNSDTYYQIIKNWNNVKLSNAQ